jgi:co-chaperonin GroES (HSP10)
MIEPLGEYLYVKPATADHTMKVGSIELNMPQTAKFETQEGVVLAVSDEIKDTVSVGDGVLYAKSAGIEFQGGKLMKIGEVIAKIKLTI